jgi:hypothetical protein
MKPVRFEGVRMVAAILAIVFAGTGIARAQTAIVADQYMTPAAGSSDLLALQSALAALEDRVVPSRFGDERGRLSLAGGILYRAAKFVGLDMPQDHMLLVVGHEVFGHGSRLRELGDGQIGYSFDAPPPYGDGGAVTSFSGEFPETPLASLTVESAGIEAQYTMADLIARESLQRGRMHYREAWLYFENRYLGMTYILSVTPTSEEGHDVADFLRTLEDACVKPACTALTSRQVKRGARFTLADPLLYVALYGFAGGYIGHGRTTLSIPMIPLGRGVRYLPSLGFQLTPYGTEHLVRNMFTVGTNGSRASTAVLTATVRLGDTGATRPWAVELFDSQVRLVGQWRAQVMTAVWKQPPLEGDVTSAPLKLGAAVTATIELPLSTVLRLNWMQASITAGYKSRGFLPGEQLGRGAIIRLGVIAGR